MGMLTSCLKKPLPVVETVDVNRMLGAWYVVAVIPTPFEKNAYNPIEKYTWDASKKRIDVDFKFNKGSLNGPISSIPQKIYTGGYPTSTGRWAASPAWPLKLDYSIMDLAEDYSWVVVGHRSRSFLWVMSRQTNLERSIVDAGLDLAKKNGFDLSKVQYPEHSDAPDADAARNHTK